jgi:hypothetical protein
VPVIGVAAWQMAAAAVTGFIAKENVVGTLAVCYGISNLIDTEALELVEGAGAAVADQFGITINDLVCDPNALPENSDSKLEKAMTQVSEKALKRKANKNVIQALSSTLVWFVALLAFVILSSFDSLERYSCLLFFVAIPANAIVLLSLRSAWHDFRWNQMLISLIVWGSLLSIFMIIYTVYHYNFWKIFLLGIPGQIAIFLWFRMFRPMKNTKKEN